MEYRNYFGQIVTEYPIFADDKYGKYIDGVAVPNWVCNNNIDKNGFDKNHVDPESLQYTAEVSLPYGTRLCRYGTEYGKFTTLHGTPYEMLGLPWKKETVPYFEYIVAADGISVKLFVTKGIVAPMFGSNGGAIQFMHQRNIMEEVDTRRLQRVESWRA